ncbi:hypothetical protein MMC25_007153 [Agyrium rufum]|nr:hypothetical protein [Agyrium rufum]
MAAGKAILLHPDLYKRNIFVSEEDPTVVTGIIDWQSSSIDPAFLHANEMPDFATTIPAPSQAEVEIPLEEKYRRRNADLCSQAYGASVRLRAPKLWAAWNLDSDLNLFFARCHRTHRDGAGVFRQTMIDLARRWRELELDQLGPCPYPLPTPEEQRAHDVEFADLERVLELRRFVLSRLGAGDDGWVSADAWEETSALHQELYEEFAKTLGEEGIDEVWPFDKPSELST